MGWSAALCCYGSTIWARIGRSDSRRIGIFLAEKETTGIVKRRIKGANPLQKCVDKVWGFVLTFVTIALVVLIAAI
jgi:hypothetical protein